MTDYAKLRAAAEAMLVPHAGAVDDRFFEMWKPEVCLEVLAAAETVKPKPSKKADYPPEFLEAMAAMEREGIKWLKGSTLPGAFMAWKARTAAGATAAEMIAGADKYARFCKATDRMVMMAQSFFGPKEFFSADWTITKADVRKGRIHGSIGKQDYSAGVGPDGSF